MSVRVAVLASGSGTNLQALLDANLSPARVEIVAVNVPGAQAIERAARAGVPSFVLDHRGFSTRADFDRALADRLVSSGVDWVVLAGFMRILGPAFLARFPDRVLNIHPSLLPAFPGLDGPGQAHAAGVKLAGCTVHLVDEGVDSGPILAQAAVPVRAQDSSDDLRRRILAEEHQLLPKVVRAAAEGRLRRDGPRAWLVGLEGEDPPVTGGVD